MKVNVKCVGYDLNSFNNEIIKGNYDMAEICYEGYYNYPLPFFKYGSLLLYIIYMGTVI